MKEKQGKKEEDSPDEKLPAKPAAAPKSGNAPKAGSKKATAAKPPAILPGKPATRTAPSKAASKNTPTAKPAAILPPKPVPAAPSKTGTKKPAAKKFPVDDLPAKPTPSNASQAAQKIPRTKLPDSKPSELSSGLSDISDKSLPPGFTSDGLPTKADDLPIPPKGRVAAKPKVKTVPYDETVSKPTKKKEPAKPKAKKVSKKEPVKEPSEDESETAEEPNPTSPRHTTSTAEKKGKGKSTAEQEPTDGGKPTDLPTPNSARHVTPTTEQKGKGRATNPDDDAAVPMFNDDAPLPRDLRIRPQPRREVIPEYIPNVNSLPQGSASTPPRNLAPLAPDTTGQVRCAIDSSSEDEDIPDVPSLPQWVPSENNPRCKRCVALIGGGWHREDVKCFGGPPCRECRGAGLSDQECGTGIYKDDDDDGDDDEDGGKGGSRKRVKFDDDDDDA